MDKIEFALPQGVVVESEQKQAMVVVDDKGQKKLKSCKTSKVVLWHFPFVRGLQFLFFGLLKYARLFAISEKMLAHINKKKNAFWVKFSWALPL